MALVAMRDMLQHAYRNGCAVGGFANEQFRPYAGDRISIDYVAVETEKLA